MTRKHTEAETAAQLPGHGRCYRRVSAGSSARQKRRKYLAAVLLPVFLSVLPVTAEPSGETEERLHVARAFLAGDWPASMETVYAFLRSPAPDGYGGVHFAAMKDMVLIRLLETDPPPEGLIPAICATVSDADAERVGRIYSAQYLSMLYPRAMKAGEEQDARLILATLREALHAPCPWLAGTALLQLGELCRDFQEIDRDRVVDAALALAGHEGVAARVAALQTGVNLDEPLLLDAARQAVVPESPSALQATALHALGILGDENDLAHLRDMVGHTGLQAPAAALHKAIRRLEERLAHTGGPQNGITR